MKHLGFLFILLTIIGCDPYGFGYKKNPAFILSEAFKAVNDQDVKKFLEASGKEAYCLYGNTEGLAYLRDHMPYQFEDMEIEPKVLSERQNRIPKFVGFWSYYNERFLVNINEKKTQKNIMQVIIECDFGAENKDVSFAKEKFKIKKFPKRECRLLKILPQEFEPLPLPSKCSQLGVTVGPDLFKEIMPPMQSLL